MVMTKEEYRKQGIPVGFGAPEEGEPLPPEMEQMQDMEGVEPEDIMAGDMGSTYRQPMAPGEKSRIVQFVHTNSPFKRNKENQLVEGEIDAEKFEAFSPWFSHNASLTIMDEREIAVSLQNLEIQELEYLWSVPRNKYSPKTNSDLRGIMELATRRTQMNRDGSALYLAFAEIMDDLKAYKVMKGKGGSRLSALTNNLRGRE